MPMVDYINNQDKRLVDDLKNEVRKGSKLKIAASCFSMYAFDALKRELTNIDELQFIFSSPAFEPPITDKLSKESREFVLSTADREYSLYGTEFEVKLRNKLTQKAIARECAEWIKKKVKFKSNTTGAGMPSFIGVESNGNKTTYMPVNGFTTVELGVANDDSIFTVIQKNDDGATSKYVFSKFDELWQDRDKLTDVTNRIIEFLSSAYTNNAPEFMYFVILYNIFSEFLADVTEDYIPNEATGFKNSLIWNKLYNFQKDGAIGIINKLEKYNGCILADSVGLGKTFTALAVMQYYSLRNKSILVLCPKRLASNWNQYLGNTRTNIFYQDRIRYDVLFHTDLSRKSGVSNGLNLAAINWGNYDLVVIDESHNFRNANPVRGKETRYDFLMNRIMKDGVNTKVLMLSATPVNNRYNDLKNQISLAYCGDFTKLDETLDTTKTVATIFSNAQRAFNAWSKLPQKERRAKDLLDKLDIDFTILLDSVTIARSRKHIKKYYDVNDIGNFPARLPAKSLMCPLTERSDVIKYKEIYNLLLKMTMNVYAPLAQVFPSALESYEKKYDVDLKSEDVRANTLGKGIDRQINRESGIKKLMTINLLKRLESSVYSFRITLKNLMGANQKVLDTISKFEAGDRNAYVEKDFYVYEAGEDPDEDDSFTMEKVSVGTKMQIRLSDIDVVTWKRDITNDQEILRTIYNSVSLVQPWDDSKLSKLKELIDDKIAHPINEGNKKVLIFSAFADTTDYLYDNLAPYMLSEYGLYTAKVQGGGSGNKTNVGGATNTDRILTLFSPIAKSKDKVYPEEQKVIDVVIGTDCISEGQNLQDCDLCINYDIHWNPVRIVQRFGRIDRIGSLNTKIQLVSFWPDISLDEYINLNKRVTARMTIVDATATGDDNIIDDNQVELDVRDEQLKKLQQGTLQDLEDADGSINITDLGLNDFRMDLVEYIKEHGEPKRAPKGMNAVVAADRDKGLVPGVIYILKNYNRGVDVNKQNRLHPYYLVYIGDDGAVQYNHLQVKQILDVLRSACKNHTEPYTELCAAFNEETQDGYDMSKYSHLLEESIGSIVDVKEEKDIDSLFSFGGTTALTGEIKGLSDFELIAFVVVKE